MRVASPPGIIRQNASTVETRAVATAALLADIPTAVVALEGLAANAAALRDGWLPVGSVEFVREAMLHAGISEPANLSYPDSLKEHFGREIHLGTIADLEGEVFVKPVQTKLFTGFVFRGAVELDSLGESDREQLQKLRQQALDCPVWLAEPVNMVAEWRVYVCDRQIIGMARYDPDGMDGVQPPDFAWIRERTQDIDHGCNVRSFALDVALLDDGRQVVCEVNDGWAIGLYGRDLHPRDYLGCLTHGGSSYATL